MKIPLTKPFFGDEEKRAIQEPLESGWVVQGPKVADFERSFAAYTGARFAVATSSCSTALHLAMIASGVGPGNEVIVPAFTWVATANAVEMQGARPVFVDIEPDSMNMDPTAIESKITTRTKAIVPVSLFGASARMNEIMEMARQHYLAVIEDDACAAGTIYADRHAGRLANMACFSFHPRKSITTGEGGMLITDDESVASLAESLRDHGASKTDYERHSGSGSYRLPEFHHVGYNYRMTDLQGALGIAQMKRLNWILEQRRRIAQRYDDEFKNLNWLTPQSTPSNSHHGYQSYVCMFHPETPTFGNIERLHAKRNEWMDYLESKGIATRPGTHAVHLLDYYSKKYGYAADDFPNSFFADQLSVALPLYAQMTEDEQTYVISHVKTF